MRGMERGVGTGLTIHTLAAVLLASGLTIIINRTEADEADPGGVEEEVTRDDQDDEDRTAEEKENRTGNEEDQLVPRAADEGDDEESIIELLDAQNPLQAKNVQCVLALIEQPETVVVMAGHPPLPV